MEAEAWPDLPVNRAGHLVLGGCDAVELAERFGTPLWVLDEDRVRAACRAYKEAFAGGDVTIAYAGKAFLTTAMARIADQEGLHLDVVSGGELYTALAAQFPPERLVLHGNNKSDEELRMALEVGVGLVVVDNFDELGRLRRLAAEAGRRQPILLRVAPGIEAHTHDYIRTGQQDSKFGFDVLTGQALAAARQVAEGGELDFVGLHCHIGSQIFETEPFAGAIERLLDLAAQIQAETGLSTRAIDIGGGLGIHYVPGDNPPSHRELAVTCLEAVRRLAAERGLPVPRLLIEPGRSIVGEAGTTLYRVGTIKRVEGLLPYVAVDGGMADNPRPALYGSVYVAVRADRPHAPPEERVRLVGRYCESGDVLIQEAHLPRVAPGDLLAVLCTGAYNYSMSSNYNRFPRPAVVLVGGGRAEVIVERESFADLVRLDRIPAHLR